MELILIRYLGGHVWNLGYFPNLVLIAAFIGMGGGFVLHTRVRQEATHRVLSWGVSALLLLVVLVNHAHPRVPGFGTFSGDVGGELFFTATPDQETSYLPFAVCFLLVVLVFALITQCTAKYFARFAPLHAYTLDIAGSCVGIVAFIGISWLTLPAWLWFAIACVPLAIVAWDGGPRVAVAVVALLGATAGLAHQRDTEMLADPALPVELEVHWSPYQKLEYVRDARGRRLITANGVMHQIMEPAERRRAQFYQIPYRHRTHAGKRVERVLIIGAGSGNDVAAALEAGARAVDAVEIDPVIASLGARHHPEKSLADERVEITIDDGRSFLTRTAHRYDVVIFALTDSLVKVSPMAQLRLENYLFTVESVRRAYEVLEADGTLVLYNYYREPWLREKLDDMVRAAVGRAPDTLWNRGDFWVLAIDRDEGGVPALAASAFEPSTDDWPFLYLRERGIPPLYARALAGMSVLVLLLLIAVHRSSGMEPKATHTPGRLALKLAFVLMGAAFLLLETKGVIQFSLLFGTTWLNSSLVFLAVLLLVLVANVLAQRFDPRSATPWTAIALVATSLLPLLIPLSSLLYVESPAMRFALAGLLTFSPVFFANLLFALSFRDQPVAEHLFGWNLIGATIGGLLEYTSMWLGYDALAWIVAGMYAAVYVLLTVSSRASPARQPQLADSRTPS